MIRWSVFPIFVFGFLLASCGRQAMAPPANGQQLRLDCVRMLQQLPEGEVTKDKWPVSVAALKPIRVERQADHIDILLQHEDHRFSMGYHVFPDAQTIPSTQGVWIRKTEWKGVFIYKTQY